MTPETSTATSPPAEGQTGSDAATGGGSWPDHSSELARLVGQAVGPPEIARDPVNRSMIRHWVEAMGDTDPVYVSDEAARREGLPGVVAPPTMLQAWGMAGLTATLAREEARASGRPAGGGSASPNDRMMALLDAEGRTSVVATNCQQHYERPLALGERLVSRAVIESISEPKATGLGHGRFITTRLDFVTVPDERALGGSVAEPSASAETLLAEGEPVATMRFRILKFRPKASAPPGASTEASSSGTGGQPRPKRPRPALTQDNAFFFEGAREGRLLIQRCASCGTLRHPPLPACAVCRSFEWDTVESSGRGTLYSYVVVHYPQVPAFDYPLAIGLVELEEGTRLVADLAGAEPGDFRIGMDLEAEFVAFDEDLTLPVFHPTDPVSDGGA